MVGNGDTEAIKKLSELEAYVKILKEEMKTVDHNKADVIQMREQIKQCPVGTN